MKNSSFFTSVVKRYLHTGTMVKAIIYLMLLFVLPASLYSQAGRNSLDELRRQRAERVRGKDMSAQKLQNFMAARAGAPANAVGPFTVTAADEITNPLQNIIQSLVGPGVVVSNIQTNLPATSNIYGSFSGGYDVLGIDQGLLMTSGSVFNALGPNISAWTSQDNGLPGYLPMGSAGFDAAVISFDVESNSNFLSFKYVFASEEYNEYVGSVFNDEFAFYITGPGFPTPTNIALIPGTTTNVAINNVNLGLNAPLYNDNETAATANPLRFQTLEYDGLTNVFTTAAINVVPGAKYTLTLVIQDVSDGVYDSGVFIQGGSISSDSCVMSLQVEKTDITCHGAHDGSIEVEYNGADGVPTFLWNTGDTAHFIEHLGPGTYTVTATDNSGCHATLAYPVVITEPAAISPQLVVTGPACSGGTTGTVTFNPIGGTAPYQYRVGNNTNSTGYFDGLAPGSYNYTLIDTNHCSITGTLVIPATISLTITPATGSSATGIEQCFDVLVTNGSNVPVPGISVAFTIGPVNTGSATIVSDVNGVAHVCYIGGLSGNDVITATACSSQATAQFTWTQASVPEAFTVTGGGVYCSNAPVQGLEIGLSGSQQNTLYQLRFDSANGSANIGLPVAGTGNPISFGIQYAHTAIGSFSVLATNQSSMQTANMLNSVTISKVLAVTPSKPAKIYGTADACPFIGEGTVTYYVRAVANATSYEWSFKNGQYADIIGVSTDTSITVQFNEGFIKDTLMVKAINNCSTVPAASAAATLIISRLLPATPGAIAGPANPCPYTGGDSLATYSITPSANATEYVWKIPAGARIMGSSSDPLFATPVTDSLITEDVMIYVSWEGVVSSSTMYITVASLNNCSRSITRSKTIRFLIPSTPGAIVSAPPGSNVCPVVGTGNSIQYSIRKVSNANNYSWKIPAGAIIVSHGGTVLSVPVSAPDSLVTTDTLISVQYPYAPPANSYIRVAAKNDCWQSADRLFSVKATLPSAPSVVSGLLNVCSKIGLASPDDTIRYSVATPYLTGATSYRWTISNPATMQVVDAGPDSIWIAVRFSYGSFVSGTIGVRSVSGCGTSSSVKTLSITTTAIGTPTALYGLANVCTKIGQTSPLDTARYTAAAVAGASGYRWTLTALTGNALIVDAALDSSWVAVKYSFGFTGGTISVRAASACGVVSASPRSLTLSVTKVSAPTSITGPTDLCPFIGTSTNVTYTATAVSGAISYNWTLPAGMQIVSGSGTRIITVNVGSGFNPPDSISVQAVTACAMSVKRTLQLPTVCPLNFASRHAADQPAADVALGAKVYPNPNNGDFTVSIKGKTGIAYAMIRVLGMNGRVVLERKVPLTNGQAIVNLSAKDAAPGYYQLLYYIGNEVGSTRFIIVR